MAPIISLSRPSRCAGIKPLRYPYPPVPSTSTVNKGRGGVVLSTVTRHMTMGPDVYRALLQAYGMVVHRNGYAVKRVSALPPFELCYDESVAAAGAVRLRRADDLAGARRGASGLDRARREPSAAWG
ncbi:basic 7S globulin 2-like [Panicum miliaceum]|uniref:Basic 7S globulin 2-like n=1 Tax=Panicum miliaceum TaxID=4540 RepID=A0A3L6PN40_PANMI|nr:basic 7S globulin 2-like [Panicum miliaceum]